MLTVTLDELRALLETGSVTLIEALPAAHYEQEHIPGAINLPDVVTPERAAALEPDTSRTVVLYCSGPSCTRSPAAAIGFEKLGYTDVRHFPGGKAAWFDAGLPIEGAQRLAS